MSIQGRKHVADNYNFEKFEKEWIKTMDNIVEKHGSWDTRQGHKRWHLMEVA
jgi:hypothetical protein